MKLLSLLTTLLTCTIAHTAFAETSLESLKAEDTLTDEQIDGFQLTAGSKWLGPNWWANRMADWSSNGDNTSEILCSPNRPFLGWRTAMDMTRNIDLSKGELAISVNAQLIPKGGAHAELADDALVGLIIGAGHSLPHYKSRALLFDFATKGKKPYPAVPGSGYAVGITGANHLKIIDLDTGRELASIAFSDFIKSKFESNRLEITTKTNGDKTKLTAGIRLKKGDFVPLTSATVPTARMKGAIGLLSHPGTRPKKGSKNNISTAESTFSHYEVIGGVKRVNTQAVGPIVMTQYTVDRGILKLTAQCMPNAGKTATLSFYRDGKWQQAATSKVAKIDEMASFRIENWDGKKAVPYRVSLPLNSSEKPATYTGLIAAEPINGKVRVAALGCVIHRPWGQVRSWNEQLYFPHSEITERALDQNPDIIFWYGDQMYEGTPSFVDGKNIHEDYLYKWLIHCVAFNETTRDRPSITIPDDHDVYQGNHWGAGARKAPKGNANFGGYRYSGEFIAQVHRTQSAHLPDSPAPNSLEQNIPAYFCDWNYGGVSFAILGDRLFKSGPAGNGLPKSGTNRPDHYNNPDFDTASLDLPHLELLGKPQEKFLADWAQDWTHGAQMKAVLSQSPFGNLATHHSGQFLIADLDSNGWPQSGRNRALSIMRSVRAPHIAGDQHLSTLVQHGIEKHDDSVFGFTAPAAANAYARGYYPGYKGNFYKAAAPTPDQYLGKRLDGFKNKVTFHAVANPNIDPQGPYHLKSQKNLGYQVPGFGIVDFDTKARTITFNSHPRSAKIADRLPNNQYPGWPKTIKDTDNDGRKLTGYLGKVELGNFVGAVVKVYNPDGTLQWAQRMTESKFSIPAYAAGEHKVIIEEQGHVHSFKTTPSAEAQMKNLELHHPIEK